MTACWWKGISGKRHYNSCRWPGDYLASVADEIPRCAGFLSQGDQPARHDTNNLFNQFFINLHTSYHVRFHPVFSQPIVPQSLA